MSQSIDTALDAREQAMLQVVAAADNVVSNVKEGGVYYHLVDKQLIDVLRQTLDAYKNANQDYLGASDGIDATPSTKEL